MAEKSFLRLCKEFIIRFTEGKILKAVAAITPIENDILVRSSLFINSIKIKLMRAEIIKNSSHNLGSDLINSL